MPLAVAREEVDSLELGDGMSEGRNLTKADMHLARLKECLLLYVNAKFVDKVSFTSLNLQVMQLGVGVRSVNGAWGVVRDALKALGPLTASEAAAVATSLDKRA